MERDSCFGKIIDIITGNEYFIRDIPCALGRITTLDGLNIIDKKNFIGKTPFIYFLPIAYTKFFRL